MILISLKVTLGNTGDVMLAALKIPSQDRHNRYLNGPTQAAGGKRVGQVEGLFEALSHLHTWCSPKYVGTATKRTYIYHLSFG